MKYLYLSLFHIFILALLASPFALYSADTNLIFCNQSVDAAGNFVGGECGWKEFILLGQKIINYLILLTIPLAAVTFAYSGFLIMTAGGDAGQVKKGKDMFTKVAIGIAWVLAAWLVINTILTALVGSEYSLLGRTS